MGGINCKEREDIGPLIDTVFELNYAILGIHLTNTFSYGNMPLQGGTLITWMTMFIALTKNMF